ncbi:MAG TPA: LLM class F420-dependent oxidoreductase [Propionibacteriaceae bacterium]|nr:LLM class F420-dependent oxidoreductase [Propionibacteriaceae bacterium]
MKIGIAMFPNIETPEPGRLGRMIEDRGLESLWFAEHSHMQVGVQLTEGGVPEDRYFNTFDPFVAMMAAAAATSKLKVATGVCLVPQRDPIHTAKEVATVDVLSAGRVIFGVGAGWNRQEMRNHGTDPKTRMRLLTERAQAMIEIWTKNEAEYHGQFVDFDPLMAWPKPAQQPYPPIIVGGTGPTVEDRILAFGDGWVPGVSGIEDEVFDRFTRLQARTDKRLELTASGPADHDRRTLDRLRGRGAHRVLVWLPQHNPRGGISDSDTEHFLDDLIANIPS